MDHSHSIAVVDDQACDREQLCALLAAYAAGRGLAWQTVGFPSGEALLDHYCPGKFQAIFLDILMEGTDGMETARRLRQADPEVLLVFVTTEADFAAAGYEVEAAGFLVKGPRLEERMGRLLPRLERKLAGDAVIVLPGGAVPAGAVQYAEVLDHKMKLHLRGGDLILRMTIGELRRLLPRDGRFFECHRGILLNLDAVRDLGEQVVVMKNGDTVPVSRRRRTKLEQAYAARTIARIRGDL